MAPAPLKIGMYYFARMMTSKSTPAVVTIAPGYVHVASQDQVIFEAPLPQTELKFSGATGAITLVGPAGKAIIAAIGSFKGAAFTPAQTEAIHQAQFAAAQDPAAQSLELSRVVWVGGPSAVDGSAWGGLQSLLNKEALDQRRVGGIVRDALIAAGARKA